MSVLGRRELRPAPAAALGTIATMLVILPGFLVGGMATFMRRDVGLTAARLGVAVAIFFAASVVASVPGGRFSEWHGPERALAIAASGGAVSLLLVGSVVRDYHALLAALALGGLANGVVHPAANLLLVRHIPPRHQGLAMGTKQASILLATLVSGLAVPTIALTIGWRWAFLIGGVVALATAGYAATTRATGRPASDRAALRTGDVPLMPMLGLAVAAALGAGTAVAMGSFLVDFATAAGLAPTWAGLLLALGSVVAVLVRVGTGYLADRSLHRPLVAVAMMMGIGAGGLFLMRLGPTVTMVIGTVVGFGVGWGWHGLLNFAVVTANPNAPGAATAITEAGAFTGAMLVPVAFGLAATAWSYPAAWLLGAGAMATAAAIVLAVNPWAQKR